MIREVKSRILLEEDVIKAVDKHTNEDGTLDNDISCILEEVNSVVIIGSKEAMKNIKANTSQKGDDDVGKMEIHYINSIADLPKPAQTVALFVIDVEMNVGYDIVTGCYVEETIVVDGAYCIKPRFYYSDLVTEITGGKVFAWTELPELDIREGWFHGRVRLS